MQYVFCSIYLENWVGRPILILRGMLQNLKKWIEFRILKKYCSLFHRDEAIALCKLGKYMNLLDED